MTRTLWEALGAIADRRGRKGRQLALQGVLGIVLAATHQRRFQFRPAVG